MTHFFLDSSVATHILDGELWTRSPQKVVGYRQELKYSTWSLKDIENEECVAQAPLVLKWARETCGGGGKLCISLTVKMELSCSPQVMLI